MNGLDELRQQVDAQITPADGTRAQPTSRRPPLTHAQIAASVARQEQLARVQNWSTPTRALGAALTLAKLTGVPDLMDRLVHPTSPPGEAEKNLADIRKRGVFAKWGDLLKSLPAAAKSFAEDIANRDPRAIMSLAQLAPLAPAALGRVAPSLMVSAADRAAGRALMETPALEHSGMAPGYIDQHLDNLRIARQVAQTSPAAEESFNRLLARRTVRSLHDEALGPAGGATIDPATGAPTRATGYAVADPKFTLDLTGVEDPRARTHAWLENPETQARLQQPGAHLGSWRNPKTGRIEISISDIVPDLQAARDLGIGRGQEAFGQLQRGRYVGDVPLPNPVASLADEYRTSRGLTHEVLPSVGTANDPDAHALIARHYETTPSTPNDPATRAGYAALMKTVEDQADFLKSKGYTMDVVNNPTIQTVYDSPEAMHNDILQNKHLSINATTADQANLPAGQEPFVPGQAHPILTNQQNDLFRWVHDIFGHTATRSGFDLGGEEQAYRNHAATIPPEALPALATETRGQTGTYFHGSKPGTFVEQKALLTPMTGDYNSIKAAAAPKFVPTRGLGIPKGDITTLGHALAHHLPTNGDIWGWMENIGQENPLLGQMLHQDPALAEKIHAASSRQLAFTRDLQPYQTISDLAAQGGPAWDKWYGPYIKALREAGIPEDVAQRFLRTSSILSTQKAPEKEVLTALRTWMAHEAGNPITTQTTQHTNAITAAATAAIRGEPWVDPETFKLGDRQKVSNYILSENTGGAGVAPTLDTWHARAYLGPNVTKYLDAKGKIKLTPQQWAVMQARTVSDAARAGLPGGDFQARVWGGITGYTPAFGESGANRADWLTSHLSSGDFDPLIEKYPGLGSLAERGAIQGEAISPEAQRLAQLSLWQQLSQGQGPISQLGGLR